MNCIIKRENKNDHFCVIGYHFVKNDFDCIGWVFQSCTTPNVCSHLINKALLIKAIQLSLKCTSTSALT